MKVGVVTVSDGVHRGSRQDESGPALKAMIERAGGRVVEYRVVPDEATMIERAILHMVDTLDLDVVLTTGGTGLAPRDVTPEATRRVIEKEVPGLAEAMRAASIAASPRAMLSRAVTGVRRHSLVINLPGSVKGATECLGVILDQLPHAVALLREAPVDH